MVKSELIKSSPLRILEKSTHGGVGKGNIGIVAARQGVGKTACLVHLATDRLFQGKHVIHVSFASTPAHIISWYEDIFQELARRLNLENAMEEHDQLVKNRVIMSFNQEGVTMEMVVKSLRSMIADGGFAADCVIIDGFNFKKNSPAQLAVFKGLAGELGLEIWFSASLMDGDIVFDEQGFPTVLTPYLNDVAILIFLKPEQGHVKLELKKDHDNVPAQDMHLRLDPKILLITGA
ncbi:MAG TPA: hypothetical protein ENN69_02400 [Spirochaetia bacterium]|nr:hypothetical protein [Spirochaetia bacterium]